MMPPVTVSVSSAWKASSPEATSKEPPWMERLVLEWTASSAESMAKLPPETVRPLSA